MKIRLKCATNIAGQKVPMDSPGKNNVMEKTCLVASDTDARQAINSQHATLATVDDHINFTLKTEKTAVK